jgi:hypothetical protein
VLASSSESRTDAKPIGMPKPGPRPAKSRRQRVCDDDHAIDTGEHEWGVDSTVTTVFDFDYEAGRDQLLRLYDMGTVADRRSNDPSNLCVAHRGCNSA